MPFVRVMPSDELWDGEMQSCTVAGKRVLLVRLGETVRAYEDRCAHLGVPLSEGTLRGSVLTCSAHHYEYDALTGCGINPCTVKLVEFPLRIEDGAICVDVARG